MYLAYADMIFGLLGNLFSLKSEVGKHSRGRTNHCHVINSAGKISKEFCEIQNFFEKFWFSVLLKSTKITNFI